MRARAKPREGQFDWRRSTVAEALGLGPDDVRDLEPYQVGHEPAEAAPRGRQTSPGTYASRAEVDDKLERSVLDAQVGVPDEWIGRRVGLSKDQVARWRKRKGIDRKPGRPSSEVVADAMAVDVFGRNPPPCVSRVDSVVEGQWEPPRYLLRLQLDYTRFAECVSRLIDSGLGPTEIAAGLGVRPRDVDHAARLWAVRKRAGQ